MEGEGAPPYWPWIQVFRALTHRPDAIAALDQVGGAASLLSRMDDEIQRRLGSQPELPELNPQQARFRLFDAVTRWLAELSSQQPLLLILDDLQWADEATWKLLSFLQQSRDSARIDVVVTCRTEDISANASVERAIGELSRHACTTQITLDGLRYDEVRDFVEATLGQTPPAGFVEKISRRTHGNPLFVNEVLRLLAREKRLDCLDQLAT